MKETNNFLGVYTVKSPYHKKAHYLPFLVVSYCHFNKTYTVRTVEYKGYTAYKIESDYSEKKIRESIEMGIILKRANPDNFKGNKEVGELIQQYLNAKNQE